MKRRWTRIQQLVREVQTGGAGPSSTVEQQQVAAAVADLLKLSLRVSRWPCCSTTCTGPTARASGYSGTWPGQSAARGFCWPEVCAMCASAKRIPSWPNCCRP